MPTLCHVVVPNYYIIITSHLWGELQIVAEASVMAAKADGPSGCLMSWNEARKRTNCTRLKYGWGILGPEYGERDFQSRRPALADSCVHRAPKVFFVHVGSGTL